LFSHKKRGESFWFMGDRLTLERISKLPQQDNDAGELSKTQVIL
jgi:hypothetical protein